MTLAKLTTIAAWICLAATILVLAIAAKRDEKPPPFPACVVRVFEDGSARFRDAEVVQADEACFAAVLAYVDQHPHGRFSPGEKNRG